MNATDKIVKLKKKYDVSRTNFAVAEQKRKDCKKEMKVLGVTPKNIKSKIKELDKEIESDEKKLNKVLGEIDEKLS